MTDLQPDVELEPSHLEDSDDDFQYEEVEVVRCAFGKSEHHHSRPPVTQLQEINDAWL